MKALFFALLAAQVTAQITVASTSSFASEIKQQVVRGTSGEVISLDYALNYVGYKPVLYVTIQKVRVELKRELFFTPSPLTVEVIFASNEPGDLSQRTATVECADYHAGVCEGILREAQSILIGYYPYDLKYPITMSVIFKGQPLTDAQTNKPYFTLSGF